MVVSAIVHTSVIVDYLRGYTLARQWFTNQQRAHLGITPIVWLEAVQGAANKIERDRAVRFLRQFYMEHPIPDDNRWAMRQLTQFGLSHGVEFPDVLIASITVRLNVPLYTLNIKHYAPLPNVDEQRPY